MRHGFQAEGSTQIGAVVQEFCDPAIVGFEEGLQDQTNKKLRLRKLLGLNRCECSGSERVPISCAASSTFRGDFDVVLIHHSYNLQLHRDKTFSTDHS